MLRFVYTRDDSGNSIERIRQDWTGADWENVLRVVHTYDDSGNTTEEVRQPWTGTGWDTGYRFVYTYDDSGNRTESLRQGRTGDGVAKHVAYRVHLRQPWGTLWRKTGKVGPGRSGRTRGALSIPTTSREIEHKKSIKSGRVRTGGTCGASCTATEPHSTDCSLQTDIPVTECEALAALYDSNKWKLLDKQFRLACRFTLLLVWCDLLLRPSSRVGSTPETIWSAHCPVRPATCPCLQVCTSPENKLTGPIPAEFGNLVELTFMALDGNELSGPIPATLGDLTNLGYLALGSNNLTGPVPESIGNLTNLLGWSPPEPKSVAGNDTAGCCCRWCICK